MRYRKKPVVVEAFLFDKEPWPEWFRGAVRSGKAEIHSGYGKIHTLEGVMRVEIGDYVIQGVKGEMYPCKQDLFADTYEPAD